MKSEYLLENLNEHLFITSDQQFGSLGLYRNVPQRQRYWTLRSLHENLVSNWNSVVKPNDFILCLGDLTQNKKNRMHSLNLVEKYSRRLNGRKLLIRGNHDIEDASWYYDFGWNCFIEYPLIFTDGRIQWLQAPTQFCGCLIAEIGGKRLLFSHFAIYEDEYRDSRYLVEKAFLRKLFEDYNCDINIHGHTHHRKVEHPHCLCACVEHTEFTPVRLKEFMHKHLSEKRLEAPITSSIYESCE